MAEVDLLQIDRGAVVAPAGCGKTQSIVEAAHRNQNKPILIITHTNAGVAALRSRLARARVPAANYRLATLDGWALRVVLGYPELSGLQPDLASIHYPTLRSAVLQAVTSGALDRIIRATYSRVIVDEYQDCNDDQHAMVLALADRLPSAVLGDPLQRIFTFAGPVPDWDAEVLVDFPLAGKLEKPWRWIQAGQDQLGQWILDIRDELMAGNGVDITSAPLAVTWTHVANPMHQAASEDQALLAMTEGTTLIIGDQFNIDSRVAVARRHEGVSVIERAELPEAIAEATKIGTGTNAQLLERGLAFAGNVMTGIVPGQAAAVRQAVTNCAATTGPVDAAYAGLVAHPSFAGVAAMLDALAAVPGERVFRPDILSIVVDALRRTPQGGDLRANAIQVREGRRSNGRVLPLRGIGSTLLLKGLEAEHSIILDGTPLDAANFYVALSRGAKTVRVLSRDNILGKN